MGQRRELFFRLLVSLGLCLGAPIPTLADTLIVNALVLVVVSCGSPAKKESSISPQDDTGFSLSRAEKFNTSA